MASDIMASLKPTSVLLADDHPLLLKGLSDIVSAEPDFDVVGTALDGETALTLIRYARPQLAVLDLAMPERGGLDILKEVVRDNAAPRIIILTALITNDQILEAIASGVWGILLKESAPEALVSCLRAVRRGERQLPPTVVERAVSHQARIAQRQRVLSELLTVRERDLVALVCEGRSNIEIARTLGLSAGTVRIHLHNIYIKLNIRNRTALAALILSNQAQ